jgi:hypothetical protein
MMTAARKLAHLPLGLALALASRPAAGEPPAPIAAKPLRPLVAPRAQVDGWTRQLCSRPEVPCAKPGDVQLYRAAGDPPGTVWAIVSTTPVLLKLLHGNGADWSVLRRWDFSGLVHSHPPDEPSDSPIAVYPALYPAGPGTWAVALISEIHGYYSGGFAIFSVADFVVLSDRTDASAATALYAGVPFECSEFIRACFGEGDSKTRGDKCHDEYEGFLTLEYAPSTPPGRYAWTAVWHDPNDGTPHPVPLPLAAGDVSGKFATIDPCSAVEVAPYSPAEVP